MHEHISDKPVVVVFVRLEHAFRIGLFRVMANVVMAWEYVIISLFVHVRLARSNVSSRSFAGMVRRAASVSTGECLSVQRSCRFLVQMRLGLMAFCPEGRECGQLVVKTLSRRSNGQRNAIHSVGCRHRLLSYFGYQDIFSRLMGALL